MNEIKIVIYLTPVTKKNHPRIVTRGNRQIVIPSKEYAEYEAKAWPYLKPLGIDYPVNIKALYYMPTHRKVDKTNLESALCDVLVKYRVIEDDNSRIVAATDGSRVLYDKENPRTEIYITKLEE